MQSAINGIGKIITQLVGQQVERPVTGRTRLPAFMADHALAAEIGFSEVVENPARRMRLAVDILALVAIVAGRLVMALTAIRSPHGGFHAMILVPAGESMIDR